MAIGLRGHGTQRRYQKFQFSQSLIATAETKNQKIKYGKFQFSQSLIATLRAFLSALMERAVSILLESYCNGCSVLMSQESTIGFNSPRVLLQLTLPKEVEKVVVVFNSPRVLLQPVASTFFLGMRKVFNSPRVLLQRFWGYTNPITATLFNSPRVLLQPSVDVCAPV